MTRDNDVTERFTTLADIRMTPSDQDEVWRGITEAMRSEAAQGQHEHFARTQRSGRGARRKRSGLLGTGAAAVAAIAIVAAGLGYGIHNHTFGGGSAEPSVTGSNGTANTAVGQASDAGALPTDPSSIEITKYTTVNSKRADVSTYTLTGTQMKTLYQAIQQTVTPSRKVPKNGSISCPTYVSSPQYTAVVWTYEIVVHYPDHPNRTFKQTYDGCLFVQDQQTGTIYMPGIQIHTKFGSLPGLTPLTWVKNK